MSRVSFDQLCNIVEPFKSYKSEKLSLSLVFLLHHLAEAASAHVVGSIERPGYGVHIQL